MNEILSWVDAQPSRMTAYRALASAAGCAWQQIPKWIQQGQIPVRRVPAIARATGIPAERLNPLVSELMHNQP
jgi:DNA-binding transcriptional regulator YdaS (Cro superfamily)